MSENKQLLADGFEEAFLGYVDPINKPITVIYDYEKCIEILINRDKMSEFEAMEDMESKVASSYMGEGTPLFLFRHTFEDFNRNLEEICV